MLIQGPILQGEGSTLPVESHHTPTSASLTSQPPLSPTSKSSIRQENEVPQPSSPSHTNVANEAASTGVDVRHGGAATTVTSLDARHGSGNIVKTLSMPQDLPLTRINTLGSDKASLTLQELTILCTTLTKKGRQEHDMEFEFDIYAAKDVSTTEEDISTAKLISTGGVAVTTTSVDVSTVGAEISTTSPKVKTTGDFGDDFSIDTIVYIRRSATKAKDKGKGIMEESESAMAKTKRQQEQERLGLEIAVRQQEEFDEEERQ
ncbi:hypothetical protein Tco_0022122, partial [Tanacetum coccineum]